MSKKQINIQETPALPGYDQNWFKVQIEGHANEVLLKLSGSAYSTITSFYKEDARKVLVLMVYNSVENTPTQKEVVITTENTSSIDEQTYKEHIRWIDRVSATSFELNN